MTEESNAARGLIAALAGVGTMSSNTMSLRGKKMFKPKSTHLWDDMGTDDENVDVGNKSEEKVPAKNDVLSPLQPRKHDTKPWARISPQEAAEMRNCIDPRLKTRLKHIERPSHNTSPWSGDAKQTTIFPVHKLSEVRERQTHDTSPWTKSEDAERTDEDTVSVCSSVSSVAPWDVDRPIRRSSRKHFSEAARRTTRLWTRKSKIQDTVSIVEDMIARGLSADTIMLRIAQMFKASSRRGRRKTSCHFKARRDQWPDGTVKDTLKNGFALISRPSGQKEIVLPSGETLIVDKPRRLPTKSNAVRDSTPASLSMAFDSVHSHAHDGKDTRSSVVLGNEGGAVKSAAPAPMAFDSVYSHAHDGKDTRSSVVLGNEGGAVKSAAPAPMAFDSVYSNAHAGKDTRSSIVFGNEGGAVKSAAPAPMAFDSVYSHAHDGKDTRSNVVLGDDGGVPPLPPASASSKRAPFLGFKSPSEKKNVPEKKSVNKKKSSPAADLHRVTRQLAYASRNMHHRGQLTTLG